jgi:cytochrome b561
MGLVFGALIVLHVAAALRHHFVLKDEVLGRMTGV